MKGGEGLRLTGLLSTRSTANRPPDKADSMARAEASLGISNLPSFLPSIADRRAEKGSPRPVEKSPSIVQYS